jgi:ubiquinone/menaquinone biosynthesis C-methylase UbiE
MSYPERIVPDDEPSGIVALHLKRYLFALPYCAGKVVLDAACGAGYGSAELAGVATRVVGVDVDEKAVEYARSRYGGDNVEFEAMDVAALEFDSTSFDVVVAFEAIEHVEDGSAFLREVARVLRPAGTFIVSTPNAAETTERPENPFHRVEYAREDFARLLSQHFRIVELFGQRRLQTRRYRVLHRLDVFDLRRRVALVRRAARLVGTPPTEAATLDDVVIEREGIERATELVAVCTEPR